jgi:hypothetical protein
VPGRSWIFVRRVWEISIKPSFATMNAKLGGLAILVGLLFSATVCRAGSFINLDFDQGSYSTFAGSTWVSLPGWTVSVNGNVVPETDAAHSGLPRLPNGDQLIRTSFSISSVGENRSLVIFGSPAEGSDAFALIPDPPGNNYIILGDYDLRMGRGIGDYISLLQTGNLDDTDKYLWLYDAGRDNRMILANGKPLRIVEGVLGEGTPEQRKYTAADLTEFAGQQNVTLEMRFTIPPNSPQNNFGSEVVGWTFDQLFFSQANIPEPGSLSLLGIGALILLGKAAHARRTVASNPGRHPSHKRNLQK